MSFDTERLVAVVMAGGGGTRFWPRSRKSKPKQFLSFDGEASLLSNTVARLDGLVPPERTLVITGREHVGLAIEHTGLPRENVIGEPMGRDTAACVGLATRIAKDIRPDAVVMVLAADHLVDPVSEFQKALLRGAEVASESQCIVTLGIRPDRPSTGYGYIKTKEIAYDGDPPAYVVDGFREKPDMETARRFLLDGCYLWNSGNLVFHVDAMEEAMQMFLPEIHRDLEAMDDPRSPEELNRVYPDLKAISIDFGVLEKTRNRLVLEPDFEWDDLGTFESVARYVGTRRDTNSSRGDVLFLDSKGSLVDNDAEGVVVLSGVSDLLVVRTGDAILIMPRKDMEQVKSVVKEMERRGFGSRL